MASVGQKSSGEGWKNMCSDPRAAANVYGPGGILYPLCGPAHRSGDPLQVVTCSLPSSTDITPFVVFQDLLSFELLDINIVQELESVPNNTPAGKKSSTATSVEFVGTVAPS